MAQWLGGPPLSAGDTGSSPGPGRSRMFHTRSGWAHAPQWLSLRSGARGPQLLGPPAAATEAYVPGARALQRQRPPR